MRILAFVTNWPPERTPQATMNSRLIEHQGWVGDVYTASAGANSQKGEIKIHEVHRPFVRISDFINRLLLRIKINIRQFPDKHILWALLCFIRALCCEKYKADTIITFSKWESAHLAGLFYKTIFQNLPWIAVFGDPWVEMEKFGYIRYSSISRRINTFLEERVLAKANVVIFVNNETFRIYLDKYPDLKNKIFILPYTFDSASYNLDSKEQKENQVKMKIRYLGDFYGPRSPLPLLETILQLKKEYPQYYQFLEIEFYGRQNYPNHKQLVQLINECGNCTFFEQVDYSKSLELMVSSDVLLVIDAKNEFSPFTPSKLIEYFGAGRPIWIISPLGAAQRIGNESGCLVSNVNNFDSIYAALVKLCEYWVNNKDLKEFVPDTDYIMQYEKKVVAKQFKEIVEKSAESAVSLKESLNNKESKV